MKKVILGLVTIFSVLIGYTANAQSNDKAAVEAVVQNYFKALNAGDAAAATAYFTSNGELLPTGAPTANGKEQILGTFNYVFDNFSYALKVTIGSVNVQGKYAIVSSTSQGNYTIKGNGDKVQASYRETFILEKEGKEWKIARYMYNQPN